MIHRWINELRNGRVDFAFETTLAGVGLRQQLASLRDAGYIVHLVDLWLPGVDAAVERVHGRVRMGATRFQIMRCNVGMGEACTTSCTCTGSWRRTG